MSMKLTLQGTIGDLPSVSVQFTPENTTSGLNPSIREAVEKAKQDLREQGIEVIEIGGTGRAE